MQLDEGYNGNAFTWCSGSIHVVHKQYVASFLDEVSSIDDHIILSLYSLSPPENNEAFAEHLPKEREVRTTTSGLARGRVISKSWSRKETERIFYRNLPFVEDKGGAKN